MVLFINTPFTCYPDLYEIEMLTLEVSWPGRTYADSAQGIQILDRRFILRSRINQPIRLSPSQDPWFGNQQACINLSKRESEHLGRSLLLDHRCDHATEVFSLNS